MSKNKWRSYKHWNVDSWEAIFKDTKMHDLSLIIAFMTGVLEAGERERVLMIEEQEGEFAYHKSMGISYARHMNNVFEEHGEILPLYSLYPVTHLCYYDMDGNLTEEDVSDMGDLLAEVVPYEELDKYEWCGNSPLAVNCDYYPPSAKVDLDEEVFHLTIYTKTDIWRPETYMSYQDDDNLELAMCHTPRLNRFLAEFKRLTLEFGGEWGNPDFPNSTHKDGIPLP